MITFPWQTQASFEALESLTAGLAQLATSHCSETHAAVGSAGSDLLLLLAKAVERGQAQGHVPWKLLASYQTVASR